MTEIFIISGVVVSIAATVAAFYKFRASRSVKKLETEKPPASPVLAAEKKTPVKAISGLAGRLAATRAALGARLQSLGDAEWKRFEEILLEADIGVATAGVLLSEAKKEIAEHKQSSTGAAIKESAQRLLGNGRNGPIQLASVRPYIISIVGVNGVGKTTTIGKLARLFSTEGSKVLLGAGDTFRAAAISQLQIWADRTGSQFVTGREGADPGAVAFDSLTAAKARGVDVVLFDTAGRLHTKTNLMDELKKIHKVMKKVIPDAPQEVLLVVDGTLGQNSLQQAREFHKELGLTGLIVTKLDGTAKGGAVLAISHELKVPIRYIGVGESDVDLLPFKSAEFIDAILGD